MRFAGVTSVSLLFLTFRLAAQPVAVQELERTCSRAIDDPHPPSLDALDAQLRQESGARASFLRGCRHLSARQYGPAGSEFEKAVREDPQTATYHFWFGRATGEQAQRANVLRQPGLARRTKGEFERAIELDSTYISPREGLLRFYIAAPGFMGGGLDHAREQADAIAKINPYRGGLARANVAFAAKDTTGLIKAHEALVAQYPDSTTPYFALVNVHQARRQWASAWSTLDGLQRVHPDLPALQYAIGRTAAESGEQLTRGDSALRRYLGHAPQPNEPSLAAAHWRLGGIAERRGDVGSAKREYEAALALDPKFTQARDALARVK